MRDGYDSTAAIMSFVAFVPPAVNDNLTERARQALEAVAKMFDVIAGGANG